MSKYFFGSFLFLIAAITFSAIAVSAAQQPEEIPAPPPQAEAADNSPAAFPHLEFSHIRALYNDAAIEKFDDLIKMHGKVLFDRAEVTAKKEAFPYFYIHCEQDVSANGQIQIIMMSHPANGDGHPVCSINWQLATDKDGYRIPGKKVVTGVTIAEKERFRKFFNLEAP